MDPLRRRAALPVILIATVSVTVTELLIVPSVIRLITLVTVIIVVTLIQLILAHLSLSAGEYDVTMCRG